MEEHGLDRPYAGGTDRPITGRIVRRVSDREGTGPHEFDENLYDAIDPDALERIFEDAPPETRLVFPFRGHLVTVHGEGTIEIASR